MGVAPMGARREEDREHKAADYLRDTHDDFWDDSPTVPPPVIGDE